MEAWELIQDPQFYVWDHVAIALHVAGGQVPSLLLLLTHLQKHQQHYCV